MPTYTLHELQAALGGRLQGDASLSLSNVASLESAGPADLSFVVGKKHLQAAQASRAGALLVSEGLAGELARDCLVVDNPHACFAQAARLFHPEPRPAPGIHPSAVIGAGAVIGPDAVIGPNVEIGPGVRIGAHAWIESGCAIGPDVVVGADFHAYPNVTVYHHCAIGDRVTLHAGCVIGSDGFGLAWAGEHWLKVPQVGRVVIGDDVEIGANTTVDRGALDDTVIEDGVKIDNLVQIAHNCRIGAHTAIAGCAGIAGSARIGRNCLIGGAAMIVGHIEICDRVTVSAGTFIAKSIRTPGVYTSTQPQMMHEDWLKNAAQLRHLDDMRERIRRLEKQLSALEGKSS